MKLITLMLVGIIAIVPLMCCGATKPAQAEEKDLFYDDFEQGTSKWNLPSGWSIVSVERNSCLKGEVSDLPARPKGGETWGDCSVSAVVQLVQGGVNISVLWAHQNRYFVDFRPNKVSICKAVSDKGAVDPSIGTTPSGGPWVEIAGNTYTIFNLATADTGLTPGQWHLLEIVVVSGHVQVYVDKELKAEYKDPKPLKKGGIGLAVFGRTDADKGIAYFDEVTVAPAPGK